MPAKKATKASTTKNNAHTSATANKAKSSVAFAGEIPVGSIVAFGGPVSSVPTGWLICDGRQISRKSFAALFDVIGTTWGGDANPNFNLPDLKGRFLRGVSQSADGTDDGTDPDRAQRAGQVNSAAPQNRGNAGNEVGSRQDDAVVTHAHALSTRNSRQGDSGQAVSGDGGGVWTGGTGVSAYGSSTETRPKNAYVWWIIRGS